MSFSSLRDSVAESERLLVEENPNGFDKSQHLERNRPSCPSPWRPAILLALATMVVSLFLNFFLGAMLLEPGCSPRQILKKTNFYSPALDAIDPEVHETKFHSSFRPAPPFQGEPDPEVDAAWSSIQALGVGRMSEKELIRAGFSSDHVSIPEEYGGGYLMELELSHQIHCLDTLRMTSFYTFAHYQALYPDWIIDSPDMKGHIGHCVEMLRQSLMCTADVGVIPMVWATNFTLPVPDFATWHRCRNWESAVAFGKARGLPQMRLWRPKEGERIIPDPFIADEREKMHYAARLGKLGIDIL